MREEVIPFDDTPKNPFEKRTKEQRTADREFIAAYLAHNPDTTKMDVFEKLIAEIKNRGDDYTLEYGYVCTEVNKVRKTATQSSINDLQSERTRTLEIINDNIALCIEEIRNRFTAREDVTTVIEDLTVKDYKGLSMEEIHLVNRIGDKIKKRSVRIKKIRPGEDAKEMMDALLGWVKSKKELLGEDEPKKIAQKIDIDMEVKQMTYEVLKQEVEEMGYDPVIIIQAIEQTTTKAKLNGQAGSDNLH